jgi:hypothetical protein
MNRFDTIAIKEVPITVAIRDGDNDILRKLDADRLAS